MLVNVANNRNAAFVLISILISISFVDLAKV